MATFSYFLKGEKPEKTVIVRLTHNREHFERAAKAKVLAKFFDKESGKVSQKVADAFELNKQIELVRSRIERALDRVKKRQLEPTKANVSAAYTVLMEQVAVLASEATTEVLNDVEQALRNEIAKLEIELASKQEELAAYLDLKNGTSRKLLSKLIIDYSNAKREQPLADQTKQNFRVLSNLIKLHYPTLLVDEVNKEMLTNFREILVDKGLRNSSISETFTRLKSVINYYAEEYDIDTRFLKKVKVAAAIQDKPVIYLEPAELKAIEDLQLTKPRQQYIRDLFLLSCYTGLRHVDLHFTSANVQNGYLQFLVSKTQRPVLVPFKKKAQKLMARMEAGSYVYNPQWVGNFSAEVKAICKDISELQHNVPTSLLPAGKGKPVPTAPKHTLISSKVGRKTFINNCLIKKVRIEVVAEWVGHFSLEMIQNHYSNKLAQSEAERYKIEDDEE